MWKFPNLIETLRIFKVPTTRWQKETGKNLHAEASVLEWRNPENPDHPGSRSPYLVPAWASSFTVGAWTALGNEWKQRCCLYLVITVLGGCRDGCTSMGTSVWIARTTQEWVSVTPEPRGRDGQILSSLNTQPPKQWTSGLVRESISK